MNELDFHIKSVEGKPVAKNMVLIRVDKPLAFSSSCRRGGQYLMFQAPSDEKPKPVAIASSPDDSRLEFLLRIDDDVQENFIAQCKAEGIRLSNATGPGFPTDKIDKRKVLMVATGTAISPILAAARELAGRSQTQEITLVYGVQDSESLPFHDEIHGLGIDFIFCLSREKEDGFVHGYVQDHLPKIADPEKTVAFICGQNAMMAAVTTQLEENGLSPEQIFKNY